MAKEYRSKTIHVPSENGDIPCVLMMPKDNTGKAPGVLWIHGGGYQSGRKEAVFVSRAEELCRLYGAVIVAPDYHLSGKAPYPAGLLDCHEVLVYMKENAAALGIRDDQIMVGGESAGGGMAIALSMFAHDFKTVNIAYLMALYPMIDYRDTESSRDNHTFIWNTRKNHKAWAKYLGDLTRVPVYASPALQDDCSGLPPVYCFVGAKDTFLSETLTFIDKMIAAGIPAEVDVVAGQAHAFDLFPIRPAAANEAIRRFNEKFAYAKEHYFAPQEEYDDH